MTTLQKIKLAMVIISLLKKGESLTILDIIQALMPLLGTRFSAEEAQAIIEVVQLVAE